jgi:chromosome segregation protein
MPDTTFWILLGCALVMGAIIGRLTSVAARAFKDRDSGGDLHHKIRSLEAGLRVAQKTAEQASERSEQQAGELADACRQRDAAQGKLARLSEELQDLRTRLRHECSKTAMLRQELSERAEDAARTSVQLRDARNELDVYNYGSDVVNAEVARLKAERDSLEGELERLRSQLGSDFDVGEPIASRG